MENTLLLKPISTNQEKEYVEKIINSDEYKLLISTHSLDYNDVDLIYFKALLVGIIQLNISNSTGILISKPNLLLTTRRTLNTLEIIGGIVCYIFEELGIDKIVIKVKENNTNMIRIMKKFKVTFNGKILGEYQKILLYYSLDKETYRIKHKNLFFNF